MRFVLAPLRAVTHKRFRDVAGQHSRLSRARRMWVWLWLPCWALGAALGGEPDGSAPKQPPPAQGLEALGFSVAPKAGGKTRTRFFGAVGEGYEFVYVLDRSGSMGRSGRAALRAVQAELIESLKNLDTVHQFQIVFYNDQPAVFSPTGTRGRLVFATEQNKERAIRFIESIRAAGGTNHEEALKVAIRLRPDVIFFLTDANEPKLTPEQLEKIREKAAGITIHAIEFGDGPQPEGGSFLADLARDNGGQHVYVDVSKPQ